MGPVPAAGGAGQLCGRAAAVHALRAGVRRVVRLYGAGDGCVRAGGLPGVPEHSAPGLPALRALLHQPAGLGLGSVPGRGQRGGGYALSGGRAGICHLCPALDCAVHLHHGILEPVRRLIRFYYEMIPLRERQRMKAVSLPEGYRTPHRAAF